MKTPQKQSRATLNNEDLGELAKLFDLLARFDFEDKKESKYGRSKEPSSSKNPKNPKEDTHDGRKLKKEKVLELNYELSKWQKTAYQDTNRSWGIIVAYCFRQAVCRKETLE